MLMTPAFFLAIYYPDVGTLAGYLGAFATALVIYAVPTITWFWMKYRKLHPEEIDSTWPGKKSDDYYKLETNKKLGDADPSDPQMKSIRVEDLDKNRQSEKNSKFDESITRSSVLNDSQKA